MKKIFILSVTAILTFSIIGCSNQKNNAIQKEQKNVINAVIKLPELRFAQVGEEPPNKNFQYEYDKNISFNGDIEVFKLVSRNIDKAKFKDLAKKFSMTIDDDNKIVHDSNTKSFYFGTDKNYLSVEEGGRFIYALNKNTDLNKKGKFKLPTDSDVSKIAKDFLEKNGLLPNDFFVSSVTNGLVAEYADGTRNVESKQVVFQRKVKGKEVLGVSRIQVDMGENGIIERIASSYRDTVAYTNGKFINIDKAVENLKNNRGLEVFKGGRQPEKCKIKKIEVAYFENPHSDTELYLYPVYKLIGETIDENGKVDEYTGIIQAIE
jgi:hypothetical protein